MYVYQFFRLRKMTYIKRIKGFITFYEYSKKSIYVCITKFFI